MSHSDQFTLAFKGYQDAVTDDSNTPVFRTEAYSYNYQRTFSPNNNTTVKSDYNYGDYSYYRPSDATSTAIEDIICECMEAYRKEPIVHQIIDLMSDFGSQGVRIICSNKAQEKFAADWAEFVGLPEFSDRFLSTLYRAGTVVVKRTDGKVPMKTQKRWKSAEARAILNNPYVLRDDAPPLGEDPKGMVIEIKDEETKKAVLPLKWTIHDPRSVVMIGGLVGQFVGKPIIGLRINTQLRYEIAQLPKLVQTGGEYQHYINMIPQYVFDAINSNAQFFPLDQSKVYTYYYKKDDWELWGKPIIEPILRDIKMYNKLKLADMSALDGAISSVRLWTLGSLEHEVVPSKAALDKLRSIISQNVAGGTMDFVWGPDLTFKESNTNLHQFLGSEKYSATTSAIYAGLGVPPGLTGSSGGASYTNNYVGLKTLIERLKYGRGVLTRFLNEQLKLVQDAMGFTKPFKVVFDQMILADEAAEKALLIQLADRDIISYETLRYAFDLDNSDIEDIKISRESRKRGNRLPIKASPFHNPEKDHELRKLVLGGGSVAPSEMGIDLKPKKPGEESPNEQMAKMKLDKLASKKRGDTMQGRPKNATDTKQRKKRRVMPKGASASYTKLFLFAESARQKIDDIITPAYLAIAGKKSVRSLSVEETESLEFIKFKAIANLEPYQIVDDNIVAELCSTAMVDEEINSEKAKLVYTFRERYGREPNISEKRKIECEAYANIFSEN